MVGEFQFRVIVEYEVAKMRSVPLVVDAAQAGASRKGPIADAFDAGAYRHPREAGAVQESLVPDAGYTVGNGQAAQAGAIVKRPVPDGDDAVPNRYAG